MSQGGPATKIDITKEMTISKSRHKEIQISKNNILI